VTVLLSCAALWLWFVLNGMSHSNLGDWWLFYGGGADLVLAAVLFVASGVAYRTRGRISMFKLVSYLFGATALASAVWVLLLSKST
jgi:hypothetical protein